MASNPQSALPWVQTLAGLFSGYLNAKQQERANPRAGFSRLPILAGGLSGLATGLAGAAQRAELLRQEQRGANDALGAYAAMSGRPVSEIQQLYGGMTPTEFRGDVGTAIREGTGNSAVARQMNLANPGGFYSADKGMLTALFGEAQKQLADTATANALPSAQAAGLNDAGGNQSGNQIMFPVVPSLASMFGPQHRAVTAALEGGPGKRLMPSLKFAPWPSMGASAPRPQPGGTPPEEGATRVYSASPSGLSAGVSMARPGVPVSEETYADLGYPKTLAQIAMESKDPKALISQYNASAGAANDRNSQLTSTLNTAQSIRGANERAILDYETPTIAGIIANGTPQQKADLKDYAEAGYRKQQSLMGTDKPATRTEIAGSVKQIQNQPTREGRLSAAKLAIQTNTLSPESALDAANSSVFGASQPITMQDLRGAGAAPHQTAPPATTPSSPGSSTIAPGNGPAVAPRAPALSDFLPFTPNLSGVNFIPRASTGAVRKRARENNGQGRINRRNYGY